MKISLLSDGKFNALADPGVSGTRSPFVGGGGGVSKFFNFQTVFGEKIGK